MTTTKTETPPETAAASAFFAIVSKDLSGDIVSSNVYYVLDEIEQLKPHRKKRLLQLCKDTLENASLGRQLDVRIATVRLLVGLLPASLSVIEEWLSKRDGSYCYEVQFTLFCYLDWCPELPDAEVLAPQILALVENYLQEVRVETARAAWMAGNMLGHHWIAEESLPVLTKLALNARFVEGRDCSVHGLHYMLGESDLDDSLRRRIIQVLKRVKRNDRSRVVRKSAAEILRKNVGCGKDS